MPRDYSSRRNNPPDKRDNRKTGKRPKPAARPVRRKKKNAPASKARSGVWIVCILLLCIAGAAAYYILSRPTGHGPEGAKIQIPGVTQALKGDNSQARAEPESAPQTQQKPETKAPTQTQPKPKFSFYKLLPQYKVKVPAAQQANPPPVAEEPPHEIDSVSQPAPEPDHSLADSNSNQSEVGYVLQAGAFSTRADANRRKARLTLLGVTASVQPVQSASGKTLYRVQSTRISSRNEAEDLSQRLSSNGIDTLLRRAE